MAETILFSCVRKIPFSIGLFFKCWYLTLWKAKMLQYTLRDLNRAWKWLEKKFTPSSWSLRKRMNKSREELSRKLLGGREKSVFTKWALRYQTAFGPKLRGLSNLNTNLKQFWHNSLEGLIVQLNFLHGLSRFSSHTIILLFSSSTPKLVSGQSHKWLTASK